MHNPISSLLLQYCTNLPILELQMTVQFPYWRRSPNLQTRLSQPTLTQSSSHNYRAFGKRWHRNRVYLAPCPLLFGFWKTISFTSDFRPWAKLWLVLIVVDKTNGRLAHLRSSLRLDVGSVQVTHPNTCKTPYTCFSAKMASVWPRVTCADQAKNTIWFSVTLNTLWSRRVVWRPVYRLRFQNKGVLRCQWRINVMVSVTFRVQCQHDLNLRRL